MLVFICFRWFSEMSCFFDGFSYIFRGDVVFIKNKKMCSLYVESGGSTCCYFMVLGMIVEIFIL